MPWDSPQQLDHNKEGVGSRQMLPVQTGSQPVNAPELLLVLCDALAPTKPRHLFHPHHLTKPSPVKPNPPISGALSVDCVFIPLHLCHRKLSASCTSFPMMSMSGSLKAPGPAIVVKPFDLSDASAQKTTMLLRLAQSACMSSQFRHRLQCRLNAL